MGDLRPDNGGNGLPPDDGGLPGFPPEWGVVVIPDDPGELADESSALRRELRREKRHNLVRRLFGLPPVRLGQGEESPNLGVPLVIMAVAVITTLVSLFVVTWDHRPSAPLPSSAITTAGQNTSTATVPGNGLPGGSGAPATGAAQLAALTFVDGSGRQVTLGSLAPEVILLMDGCACTNLVIDIAEAAGSHGVNLVAVDRSAPTLAGAPQNTHPIADPRGTLRQLYLSGASPVPGKPSALLVRRDGMLAKTVQSISSVADVQGPLDEVFQG